jgi:glycerol kinase
MQIVDILEAMSSDSGQTLSMLKVDGGMSNNNLMMQMQADLLHTSCSRPQVLETTALGAAFLAGLGVGFWSSTQAISEAWCLDRQFHPKTSEEDVSQKKEAWRKAIKRASI